MEINKIVQYLLEKDAHITTPQSAWLRAIRDAMPIVKGNVSSLVRYSHHPVKTKKPQHHLITGPSGAGKTTKARGLPMPTKEEWKDKHLVATELYNYIQPTLKEWEKKASILAHIAGPSGSGKSTILRDILAKYPNLTPYDLDINQEDAANDLGYDMGTKDTWTPEQTTNHFAQQQKRLEQFEKANPEHPLVLGGFHVEDEHALNIDTPNKFLLDRGALRSTLQKHWRNLTQHYNPNLSKIPGDYGRAKFVINDLKDRGYQPTGYNNIMSFLAKQAAYDPPYPMEKLPEHLLKCPIHTWRAKSGIELIHKEPTAKELHRIWGNWKQMTSEQQAISDKKSIELFGMCNKEHYKKLTSK